MQKYIEIAFKSRGLEPEFDGVPLCEFCRKRGAQDVDHIEGRKGKLLNDPENLIFLCRNCHTNKGGYKRKQEAKEIVQKAIDRSLYF